MNIQIKKKQILNMTLNAACLVAAVLVAGCESEEREGHHKAELKAEAKITEAQARTTAMNRVPDGTIKEAELEKEKGKLIWSFDIARPETKDITEVNIDAITGEIVAVDIETPKEQSKEKGDKDKD